MRAQLYMIAGISALLLGAKGNGVDYSLDLSQGEKRTPDSWMKQGGTNPQGEEVGVNSLYWTRDSKPWTPVMGEFHFFRYPADLWEEELLKMKAGGVSIVSSCVYWGYAESSPGKWNWNGNNDLRRFVELCKKHGLYVWIRIGPYINAEIVRGGLPSWIDKEGKRSNAPWYLDEVRKYYAQVADQVKGLYYKDGGPIIGCQLENEYAHGSKDHVVELKSMAKSFGIDTPFYSATANTEYHYDQGGIIPLLGAYPYRFWQPYVETSDFLYMTDEWGAMENLGRLYYDWSKFPRGMCELGGGYLDSNNHRFQIPVHDLEASSQAMIGKGVNLIGYYMYQGGTNEAGWASPGCARNYDYQAPLGEFGQLRPSYHALRILHMFMNDFGDILAPTQPVRPANMVKEPKDVSRVRYVGRFKDDRGFVFLNTCQPWVKTHPVKNVQFEVKLSGETMKVPASPITVPANTSPIFPINLDMNGVRLRYSTARLMAKVDDKGIPCFIFCEEKGIRSEFQFAPGSEVCSSAPPVEQEAGVSCYPTPSRSIAMTIGSGGMKKATVLLLSRQDAECAWRMDFGGKPRLILSDSNVLANSGTMELSSVKNSMNMSVFPSLEKPLLNVSPQADGDFSSYTFTTPRVRLEVEGTALPAPSWTVPVLPLPDNVRDIYFQVNYTGSTADLMADETQYTDNRHNGLPFEFSVKRFINSGTKKLTVFARPWDKNVQGLPQEVIPTTSEEEKGMIRSVRCVPEYLISIPDAAL